MRKSILSIAFFQIAVFALITLFPLLGGCKKTESPAPTPESASEEAKPTAVEAYQQDINSTSNEDIVLLSEEDAETASSAETAASEIPGADGLVKVVKPENTLAQLTNSAPIVVIDFNATWCGPCKRLGPYIERMAATFQEKNVSFFSADVDEVEGLSKELGVSSIPDVRIFVNGQQVDSQVGCEPIELFGKLEAATGSAAPADSAASAQ